MIPIETIKELASYHGVTEGGYYRSIDDSSVYTYTFDECEFIAFARAIEAMAIDRCLDIVWGELSIEQSYIVEAIRALKDKE